MASDFFESDQLVSDADSAGQPEILTDEPQAAAAPRPVRLSLFQRVCLGDKSQAKPGT